MDGLTVIVENTHSTIVTKLELPRMYVGMNNGPTHSFMERGQLHIRRRRSGHRKRRKRMRTY